jgi:hypothetical protein
MMSSIAARAGGGGPNHVNSSTNVVSKNPSSMSVVNHPVVKEEPRQKIECTQIHQDDYFNDEEAIQIGEALKTPKISHAVDE